MADAPGFTFEFDWGVHTMMRLLDSYEFDTVLDVGSGAGEHSRFLRHFGKQVFTTDLHQSADYAGDFVQLAFDRTFDVVWCSHVLEHQRNVGAFLEKLYECLAEDGVLAITVPTHPRERLISGHITTWNAGLLCYNLVLAGFDCREARVCQTYELGIIVRKVGARGPDIRAAAAYGKIDALAQFFPFPVADGANAEVAEANWGEREYDLPPAQLAGPIHVKSRYAEIRFN
jgi:SAM-dependent methyltransferase